MSARFMFACGLIGLMTGCDLDGVLADDTSTGDDASADCACDASITKQPAGDFVAGQSAVWQIDVEWQGAEYCAIEQLCFEDVLPEGQFFSAASIDWTCTDDSGTVTCCATDFDPAEPFMDYTMKLEVDLADDLQGTVENCATLDIVDSYPDNNSSCATVDVAPPPAYVDLAVTKTVGDPGYMTAGEAGVFFFEVTNNGTGDAAGVYLADVLPDGFSMDDQQNGDWFCTGDDGAPEAVLCQHAGIIGAGQTEILKLQVELDTPWEHEYYAENCATVDLDGGEDVNMEDNQSCVSFDIAIPDEVCGNCLDDDNDGEVDEDCEYTLDVLFSADDQVTMYVDGTQITQTIGYSTSDSFSQTIVGGGSTHYVAAFVEDIGGTIAAYKAEIQLDGFQMAVTGDGSFKGSASNPGTGWETDTSNLTDSWTVQSHNSYWNGVPLDLTATGAEWVWFGGGTGYGGNNYVVYEFEVCPSMDSTAEQR